MNAATTVCTHDAHDWQPISGWYARYRCSICRVIGRKPGAIHPQRGRSAAIEPYRLTMRALVAGQSRCDVAGSCGSAAVGSVPRGAIAIIYSSAAIGCACVA